ncbi:hypothetical protein PHLGIDRAFT_33875 [Phlebiopsis gigantea 11061_1 CR5-6]|uniref:NAD(P)-binding domain-containing protein n=1 Tax=Phlebiopsis gigantea (strain 11061_1 CR5-6) TaxID=745531 RepID=A0A0C3S475_PHLG1|nr:hypothetical protein PHLGIDRAFT_33875 [Phlebiopsis gigantea 11061_1 CR5-6]
MSTKIPVLFLGATGYVGGSVLTRLLARPDAQTFEITALVRSEEKAKKLEDFGVKTAVGSFKNDVLVERLSEAAHVVFSCADSDDLPAIQALLKGLKQRHVKTGDVPILIHTSGTGILTYGHETKGMSATDAIYDDSDFEQVANIDPAAFHRNVDSAIFDADREGYCRAYIVIPSTIYTVAKGPLVDAGIQKKHSHQIPALIRASLARGQAGVVGKGLALWPDVHLDDQVEFYTVLYDAIVKNGPDNVDHGIQGYYYGESGEHSWYDISKEIGRVMVELGLSKSDEPTSFTAEELAKYFGSEEFGNYWGTNSRARGTHSRSLGWKPRYTTADMIASIKPEVEAILREQQR